MSVCIADVCVLWLNVSRDRVGFWCGGFTTKDSCFILDGPVSAHGKGDFPRRWDHVGIGRISAVTMPRLAISAVVELLSLAVQRPSPNLSSSRQRQSVQDSVNDGMKLENMHCVNPLRCMLYTACAFVECFSLVPFDGEFAKPSALLSQWQSLG